MAGNSFGRVFKIMTYGESHGPAIGVTIDGVPPQISLSEEDIQLELNRRKPGQSSVTTPRKEADRVEILSGIFEGQTTGAPISLIIRNENQRSKDYSNIKDIFRPGHADYVYQTKYGIRDYRGGGRSSGRETAARVAAGAIAKRILHTMGIEVTAFTEQVGDIRMEQFDASVIETNTVRCPDPKQAKKMIQLIEKMRDEGDSIGGVVGAKITGCPVGLGEPAFDKLDACLAHAILSIQTTKGIEFGAGFNVATMTGSENNDEWVPDADRITTTTNHSGGIQAGISNGEEITLRVAIKPPSSISKKQQTVTKEFDRQTVEVHGRHDPCICPRVVPVIEAMIAITLVDAFCVFRSTQSLSKT